MRDLGETSEPATTVVIVDDHDMVAVGLASLLEENTDIAVVGRARSVAEASAVVARQRPDVVLMDYRLPDGTGADATRTLRALENPPAVVIVSSSVGRRLLGQAVDAGCCGYAMVHFERLPHHEVEISAESAVVTSDAHRVGSVEGLVLADDDHVNAVVVRAGPHGIRHHVVVPVASLARTLGDLVVLSIDREHFRSLPVNDDALGPDGSGVGSAADRASHGASPACERHRSTIGDRRLVTGGLQH